jgi:hypothetical protein
MASATILNKLAQVRHRERLVRFLWGVARVLAVTLALLAVCCFADWLIDRWYDTPRWLLTSFLVVQCGVLGSLTLVLIALPVFKPLSNSTVAQWVEQAFPEFRHRLITAVELNRSHAAIAGMSPVLIAAVTKEAEQKAAKTNFGLAVDSRRLRWSAFVIAPVLLFVLLLVALAPLTVGELLSRQLLLPVEITRSVRFALQDVTTLPPDNLLNRDEPRLPHHDLHEPAICASGDAVAVHFKAAGAGNKDLRGTLRIRPEGGSTEDHELVWESDTPDGKAIFVAVVPPSSVKFTYKAWLGDARMRQEGQVEFEARPTVESQTARMILPAYCGLRSDGTRFEEEEQVKGEVLGLSGSSSVVTIQASKPLKKATLELLGPSQGGAPEQVLSATNMTLDAGKQTASCRFNLDARQTAYRILVWDQFGFANRVIPRRGIAQIPDEPPQVALLPEDDETEGAPVIYGKRLLVGYRTNSPAGLYAARFRYRIVHDRGESEREFQTLPLTEYNGSSDVGEFDLNRGLFAHIRDNDYQARVEFHALAERKKPGRVPDRREGGGRVIFETAKIPELKLGDRIEYYVEVLDTRPAHLEGRSEARIKEVVNAEQFAAWIKQKLREDQKLQELAARQGTVFDPQQPAPNR